MVEGVDFHSSRILSVCSGTGQLDTGIRVALPRSRVVCCVEHEAYAAHILASRMEDEALDAAPIWTNLRTFNGRPWRGLVDGIVGGYPCQPFSQAGKRRGEEDPRHLWPVIRQNISWIRPRWCWFENVRGHLNLGFEKVYRDLCRLGYRVEAGLFSADEVGASHRRERLFILAYRPESQRSWRAFKISDGEEGRDGSWGRGHGMADTKNARQAWGHREQPSLARRQESRTERHGEQLVNPGVVREQGNKLGESEVLPTERYQELADPKHRAGLKATGVKSSVELPVPWGESGTVAEPGGEGLQDSELGRVGTPTLFERTREVRTSASELCGTFAPGPSDLSRWGGVISNGSGNYLAPATQPGLRVLADGVALVVDESRADQLRAVGNGVVPLQAAFAFSVLTRKMGIVI